MSEQRRIGVIVGSTRPTRICPGLAAWVAAVAQEDSSLRYDVIDLAEVGLPFLDEPLKPALGRYEHEHTKAWSRTVDACAGFVLVFPQYNWGYPAPLKNALDFLYAEWSGKPVTCVTYGTRGGGKGAEQMAGVLDGLHMRQLQTAVRVVIGDDAVDDAFQLVDLEATMHPYRALVREIDAEFGEALEDTQ